MRVYGYVRLSRDEDKENYGSILQQKNIIQEKASELGLTVEKIYEDDNISGYIFDRPALNQMIKDVEAGKVDLIIAKDSSRIGRHNAKTLLLFEFFQENNTRLILPSENYDSHRDDNDLLSLRTWYNEMYIKDISRKITDNIRSKQKNGGMIVRCPFGYKKDDKDKHKLLIDEDAAEIIRNIFRMYTNGMGYRKIAEELNNSKYPTPSQYNNYHLGGSFKVAKEWSSVHVQRIITNDFYAGVLRCGKTKKKTIKGQSIAVPKEEQIQYKNHHPSIIPIEEFILAKEISVERNKRKVRGGKNGLNLYSGFLFCNECGSYMITRRIKFGTFYYCGNYHQKGRKACGPHRIKEEDLSIIIIQQLKAIFTSYITDCESLVEEVDKYKKNTSYKKNLENLLISIDNKKDEIKNYTRLYARGKIDEDIYQQLMEEAKGCIEIMEKTKEKNLILNLNKSIMNSIGSKETINHIINTYELTRFDIEHLIKKIIIKEDALLHKVVAVDIFWSI